ncbi:endonuclease domain-containing protein [Methylobrevis sp. L22]|uniref:Endonuclease domain-containing protein n=1 Tax=Methylobrevis albus TaxID=2793297 RepID=A0A931HXY5_9HYPH|nr:endonuclease domain-containing protein [Methylobrevis albus]
MQPVARRLRKEMTEHERRLWYRVRAHRFEGFGFRRQVPIGPYVVDFLCAEAKLVVELDGDSHGEQRQQARDATRDDYLTTEGYRILRIWNFEIMDDFDAVLDRLLAELSGASVAA